MTDLNAVPARGSFDIGRPTDRTYVNNVLEENDAFDVTDEQYFAVRKDAERCRFDSTPGARHAPEGRRHV